MIKQIKATSITLLTFLFVTIINCPAQIAYLPDFTESADPETYGQTQWTNISGGLHAAWGSTDILYKKGNVPNVNATTNSITLWKGEKANLLILLWTKNGAEEVECISSENIKTYFTRYVLSDQFTVGEAAACALRTPHQAQYSHLVPDILDYIPKMTIEAKTARPVWVTVEAPRNMAAGEYSEQIVVRSNSDADKILNLQIKVLEHTLPPPKNWNFHLDLWQNSVSISRIHDVKLWSDKHFEYCAEYFKPLADAGQKVMTAVINWGGQSFDDWFEPMIIWKKNPDGTMVYDYTAFDKFVEMMMSIGIDEQINCYSLYPWGGTTGYYDVASDSWVRFNRTPGTTSYENFYAPFLHDFKAHLIQKGWFEKTVIAMDEKPEDIMSGVIDFIKRTEPGFKVALAGQYISSVQSDVHDLSIFIGNPTSQANMQNRKNQGKVTTFYTSCSYPEHPNQFTFSPPAESAVVGWYAYAQGYDGYLRWAFNIWSQNVLKNSRSNSAPAGDQYLFYPGPRYSVRMARLHEGIQDYEKIRILMKHLEQQGTTDAIAKKNRLNTTLAKFSHSAVQANDVAPLVNGGKNVLKEISMEIPNITDVDILIPDDGQLLYTEYYDLQGVRIIEPNVNGLYIKKERYSKQIKTSKIIYVKQDKK